jgi:hypothetical protein
MVLCPFLSSNGLLIYFSHSLTRRQLQNRLSQVSLILLGLYACVHDMVRVYLLFYILPPVFYAKAVFYQLEAVLLFLGAL